MGVDELGESGFVSIVADEGVRCPNELIASYSLAGVGHTRQTEIGGVGEDCRQKRVFVRARLAGAQIREGGQEPCVARDFVENFRDSSTRHHVVDALGEFLGLWRGVCPNRRDAELAIAQRDAIELAAAQQLREAFEPPVKLPATAFQPTFGARRKAEFAGYRRRLCQSNGRSSALGAARADPSRD